MTHEERLHLLKELRKEAFLALEPRVRAWINAQHNGPKTAESDPVQLHRRTP